jgi:serpin B
MMKPARPALLSRGLRQFLLGSAVALTAAAPACSKAKEAAPSTPATPASPATSDPAATPTEPAAPPATEPTANPAADPDQPKLVVDPAALPAAARGDLGFASLLHGALRKEPGNLFFSPASVRLAMAMTAMGARGKTAEELTRGLGLDKDPAATAAGFAAILDSFAQRSKVPATLGMQDWEREEALRHLSTVAIANRVWPQAGRPFEQSYLDTLASRFGAPVQALDFGASSEAARKTINGWVAERTQQKIPELLQPPDVTASTKLILTNAIYFKAQWDEPFNERATADAKFTTAAGKKVPVRMMSRLDYMSYAETPLYQAVELPYADGSMSMTIVLPRAGKSLADVEAKLLAAPEVALVGQRVSLQLPKFKIEARFALADTLAKLGMGSAFTSGAADFSGMDGTHELFIDNVVHQAVITVDENGTEAAAATAVGMKAGAAAPVQPPKSFLADRPFAFFIRDTKTGLVLFAGRLADPTAK